MAPKICKTVKAQKDQRPKSSDLQKQKLRQKVMYDQNPEQPPPGSVKYEWTRCLGLWCDVGWFWSCNKSDLRFCARCNARKALAGSLPHVYAAPKE